jgi:triosephosphate isomerase
VTVKNPSYDLMNKRKPIVAGNWKMNGTRHSVDALLTRLKADSKDIPDVHLLIFPPAIFLEQTERLLSKTQIAWGGQNMHDQPFGAFTGEMSSGMLCDFGCRYVLLGHSERRHLFGETDAQVASKYQMALHTGLTPIVCIGETLEERNKHLTDHVLRKQLEAIFSSTDETDHLRQLVIAYEPVWAIGTGLSADPDIAQAVHANIRAWIAEYDQTAAKNVSILYGGSLKKDNATALFAMPDIDGGLIGGASLNATEFLDIAHLCSNSSQHYTS